MNDFRFRARAMPAYFDEDTVFDEREIEFSIFDIRDSKDDVFFVEITYGQTPYLCACYKESLEPLYDIPDAAPRGQRIVLTKTP